MLRPCFLVIDRELPAGLSTRKLVIETAKLNVITAYSGAEALEALEKFPRVDGIVLDTGMRDIAATDLVRQLRAMQPHIRVVAVGRHACDGADFHMGSFDPHKLLALLQSLEPEKSAVIQEHDEQLAEEA